MLPSAMAVRKADDQLVADHQLGLGWADAASNSAARPAGRQRRMMRKLAFMVISVGETASRRVRLLRVAAV